MILSALLSGEDQRLDEGLAENGRTLSLNVEKGREALQCVQREVLAYVAPKRVSRCPFYTFQEECRETECTHQ